MVIPAVCRAAVFEGAGEPIVLREFELPGELPAGSVLCRIRLSTICGSDLHTILGRRVEPAPSILGHESVGEVVAVGDGARYWDGSRIEPGERVSWTIMASCGTCVRCLRNLPQKCLELRKYGHMPTEVWPGLTGGYAEYIYLFPGTGIFRVTPGLDDAVVAPANCALATDVCAVESIGGIAPGDRVLISGAGMLGVYLAALAAEAGAGLVMVADTNASRAEAAKQFGAGAVFGGDMEPGAVARWARGQCGDEGVDVAFEVCGDPRAASASLDALRSGGRLLVAGLVSANSVFPVDGNVLTRKCLTVRGIHNYHPSHLETALRFLAETADKYPYRTLVGPIVALPEMERAIALARAGTALRVGLRPF